MNPGPLDSEDGRYYAIGKRGTDVVAISTEERLEGSVVGFGLPSAPGLALNLARRHYLRTKDVNPMNLFKHNQQGISPDDQGPLFDFLEDMMGHIIFSLTSLEAFSNEVVPDGFHYTFKRRNGTEEELDKEGIERWVGLDEKLGKVLPLAHACASPEGTLHWENFQALKRIRNRLVHLKSSDRTRTGPEVKTIWGDLLRAQNQAFCDQAHALMGHFAPAVNGRRWYASYPYKN